MNSSDTARSLIQHELTYRREKQWRIFSWVATLLVAVIGGVVTLAAKGEFVFSMWPQRAMMAVAVLVITVYGCLWIAENINTEAAVRSELLGKNRTPSIPDAVLPDPNAAPYRGYIVSLALLGAAALLTILFVPASASSRGVQPNKTLQQTPQTR